MNPTETGIATKWCYVCGQEKPISEFYKYSQNKKRYMIRCKSCYPKYAYLERCGTGKLRKASRRVKQLAAVLHMAQRCGVIDVTACMKLVRSGKWDEFLEVG